MRSLLAASASFLACVCASQVHAQAQVITGHDEADAGFKLGQILPPATNDAASKATLKIVDGKAGGNAPLSVLTDGKVPKGDDEPGANFFFSNDTENGRFSLDLGSVISVKTIATYSWHNSGRAPQLYRVWGADGKATDFNAEPKKGTDPKNAGWKLIATVDTRLKSGEPGGQHAAEITDKRPGGLGEFQYLLFESARTAEKDPFANTFFSEIDVIDAKAPEVERLKAVERIVRTYVSSDKKYTYIINSTKAPELTEWSEKELVPVIKDWYPKIVALLPSKGYISPTTVSFEFKEDMGGTPAYAAGNRISMNRKWFNDQLKGEAKGSVVHEMAHVVQNYWRARQTNPNPSPTPGWITEGIPDYVRWFLYEPESKGAEITARNIGGAKYDGSYRTSANFLNWAQKKYDRQLMEKLNAAAREGRYSEKLWKTWTSKTVQELGEEWLADCRKAIEDKKK